ncbi:hypothetical protein [Goekera deserti]|nr:hypothetical protein [Goekera deserti]
MAHHIKGVSGSNLMLLPSGEEHRWLAVGGAVSVDRQLRTEGYSW